MPEKYEATITTLENTTDLSKITLAELLNALQAQEQRRLMRQDGAAEGALPTIVSISWNFQKILNLPFFSDFHFLIFELTSSLNHLIVLFNKM